MKSLFILLLCSFLCLGACSTALLKTPEEENKIEILSGNTEILPPEEIIPSPSPEEQHRQALIEKKRQLVEQVKKRKIFANHIRQGDYYFLKNEKELALRSYIVAYIRLERKDSVLAQKIADTYFSLQDYKRAIDYYEPLEITHPESQENYAWAIYYQQDPEMIDRLTRKSIDPQTIDFFRLLRLCNTAYNDCIPAISTYTRSSDRITHLQEALQQYEHFQINDLTYRDALMVQAFIQDRDYINAIRIGERLLANRPDYRSILQLIGYAYYETQDYTSAARYLQEYLKFEPQDASIAFLLGRTYFEMEDYETASVYFNTAILQGYIHKSVAERYLAYTYYLLGSIDNLISVGNYLLEGSDAREDDFISLIYIILQEDHLTDGIRWAKKGQSLYPKSSMIIALLGWSIYLQDTTCDIALELLTDALTYDEKNPLALLQSGVCFYEKNNLLLAKSFFNRTIQQDASGSFGREARSYLDRISLSSSHERTRQEK